MLFPFLFFSFFFLFFFCFFFFLKKKLTPLTHVDLLNRGQNDRQATTLQTVPPVPALPAAANEYLDLALVPPAAAAATTVDSDHDCKRENDATGDDNDNNINNNDDERSAPGPRLSIAFGKQ
jgi:hypothetical protein